MYPMDDTCSAQLDTWKAVAEAAPRDGADGNKCKQRRLRVTVYNAQPRGYCITSGTVDHADGVWVIQCTDGW